MNFSILKKWVLGRIDIPKRLKGIVVAYVLFLMVAVRKHSMEQGANFWGVNKSQFSRLLKNHADLAVYNLEKLSRRQAKQFSKVMKLLANGTLPWKIAIIIDSTRQVHLAFRQCQQTQSWQGLCYWPSMDQHCLDH